jgi:hypothetical protein
MVVMNTLSHNEGKKIFLGRIKKKRKANFLSEECNTQYSRNGNWLYKGQAGLEHTHSLARFCCTKNSLHTPGKVILTFGVCEVSKSTAICAFQ